MIFSFSGKKVSGFSVQVSGTSVYRQVVADNQNSVAGTAGEP